MGAALAIILTGVLVATACALLGVFLVLRRMAMMADAISHAILPGLVAGYFLAQGPNLLAGFVGASLAAVVTVALVEALHHTHRVGGESAIGVVFPAMFALGTFLVSKYFANVHLDADAVLYGNIEFVAFDVLILNGTNLGPQSLWVMGALCAANLLFVGLLFKELKLATFDPGLAAALGFSPMLIHYGLMAMVSITAVGAFTAVGAILVVAFMIAPAATAYLLTSDLGRMIVFAVFTGALSALSGGFVAFALDVSVAGAMATMAGACFLLALLFSPAHGLVTQARRLRRRRLRLAMENLVVHLFNHEHQAYEEHEAEVAHLSSELRWQPQFARRIIRMARRAQLVQQVNGHLALTDAGREFARRASARRDGEA
ncbi:MAG: metal ABC transporter permease [Chloroflexi bacterium]|jgi:manganese/zinc/iron transport system permease protein|uniref:Zinc ABC transporter permease n=1 Tax=Candidatus Thermofonsia Clade 3 bacterium TaxID=2364212 RepID=A0A2M8QF62_9CHLR|nr:metal ABC transporter permease [Candidatus Roseilinea sp. NK_OTU-006]PJF48447.1 MAG: zinc ABC transporter permease [Candidatus Thermofonsia Clade 3 bacterium]RMG66154.1 MAG: metal ABC transporter permease [Chloroflexota bacterium]